MEVCLCRNPWKKVSNSNGRVAKLTSMSTLEEDDVAGMGGEWKPVLPFQNVSKNPQGILNLRLCTRLQHTVEYVNTVYCGENIALSSML